MKHSDVAPAAVRSRQTLARSVVKRGSLSLVAILVLAVLGEVGLRGRQWYRHGTLAVPAWLRMGEPVAGKWHPFLRTVPRPSVVWTEVDGAKSSRIVINSLGFRSREFAEQKPEGCFRVACVGASVVFDTRVDLGDSWPAQLESRLRARLPGRDVEVINAGLPSRTSADSVVNLALRVLPLDPDVVILMHGINDQKPNRYPGFRPDYSHWYAEPERNGCHRLWNAAINRSMLASCIRYRLMALVNPLLWENWRGESVKRYDTVSRPGLDAYRRNLESMIGMCRIRGVRTVIATVGFSATDNADWDPDHATTHPLVYCNSSLTLKGVVHGFKEYNGVSRDVAGTNDCVLVDVAKLLPATSAYYQDDVHYTATGSARVATMFAEGVPWQEWIGPEDEDEPARTPGGREVFE